MKVQIVWINNEAFFVCNATGLLLKDRYFIPGEQKHGAFVTLPVALRWIKDHTDLTEEQFEEVRECMQAHFKQPIIPLHPNPIQIPVGHLSCREEVLSEMELGVSWMHVAGSENVEDYLKNPSHSRIQKKVAEKGSDINEAWLTLFK